MSAKRPSLSRLQKRARDKASRLRVRGASAEAVAAVSPVKPWDEVLAYTPAQKRAYRQQLKKWTSRDTAFVVSEPEVDFESFVAGVKRPTGGNLIPKADVLRLKSLAKELQRMSRKMYEDVAGIKVDYSVPGAKGGIRKDVVGGEGDLNAFQTTKYRSVYGGLPEFEVKFAPTSARGAKRMQRNLEHAIARDMAKRRKQSRANAVKMARQLGNDKLARGLANMSAKAFDVLANRTDFFELLALAYAESQAASGYKGAAIASTEDTQSSMLGMAEELYHVSRRAVR